jgi:hypothetical protein
MMIPKLLPLVLVGMCTVLVSMIRCIVRIIRIRKDMSISRLLCILVLVMTTGLSVPFLIRKKGRK